MSIAKVLEGLPKVQKPEPRPRLKAVSPTDLQKAYLKALEAQARREPRELNPDETLVALQRKWHLVYSNSVPDDSETLMRVVPSGLTETERRGFLLGSLEEAKRAFLIILNTSWTRERFWEAAREAGVHNALAVFEEATRRDLEHTIRFKTDR